MKKETIGSLLFAAMLFSGCSRGASPQSVNGKYYMGGDDSCIRYRVYDDNRIICIDSDGKDTGYRSAMSNQELQMHMNQKSTK